MPSCPREEEQFPALERKGKSDFAVRQLSALHSKKRAGPAKERAAKWGETALTVSAKRIRGSRLRAGGRANKSLPGGQLSWLFLYLGKRGPLLGGSTFVIFVSFVRCPFQSRVLVASVGRKKSRFRKESP